MLTVFAITLTAMGAVFSAQEEAGSDRRDAAIGAIIACRSETGEAGRLACFDAAARQLAATVEMASTDPVPAPVASRAPASLDDRGAAPTPTPSPEPSTAQAARPAVDPVADAADSFGEEDLITSRRADAEKDGEKDVREVGGRAVRVQRTRGGDLVVTLDNGQVWEQLSSDNGRPRVDSDDVPIVISLRKGLFGSHFLSFEDERPAIRVRRIE